MRPSSLVMSVTQRAQSLFGPEFGSTFQPDAERHEHLLGAFSRAIADGDKRSARERQHRVYTSHSSRLVALVRSLKREDGFTPERLRDAASALSILADPGEPVRVWVEAKSSGQGHRHLSSFGPLRKAQQTLCADLLRAAHGLEPFDFLAKGRGADRAADHINRLVDDGHRFFVLADIADFFSSAQQQQKGGVIRLPKAAIAKSIVLPPRGEAPSP